MKSTRSKSNLKVYRNLANLSQRSLAADLDVTDKTIAVWEKEVPIYAQKMILAARKLNTTVEQLFFVS